MRKGFWQGVLQQCILLVGGLAVGCAMTPRPSGGTRAVPRSVLEVSGPVRGLAVLPAAGDSGAVERGIAGAEIVRAALWSLPPDLPVYGLEGLLWRSEDSADCLLSPSRPGACLPVDWPHPWLEVHVDGSLLRLRLQGPLTDGEPWGRVLEPVPLGAPVEQLGPMLAARLGLRVAPLPVQEEDRPHPAQGRCLEPEQLAPLGALKRAVLLTRYGQAQSDQPTLSGLEPSSVPVESGPFPSLLLLLQEGLRTLEAQTPPSGSLLARALIADARLALQAPDAARAALQGPLSGQCGYPDALLALARAQQAQGALAEASIALGLAARQVPFQEEILAGWATLLVETGRAEDGARVLRRVLALDSGRLWARRALADALAQAGRAAEARGVLVEGLQRHADALSKAWLELDLGLLEEAAEAWARAALHHRRGLELLAAEAAPGEEESGRLEVHEARAARAIQERRRVRSALLNSLGVALLETGAPEDAVTALEEAVVLRLGPGSDASPRLKSNSLYNLGVALSRTGAWDEAGRRLEAAADQAGGEDGRLIRVDWARLLHLDQRHREAAEVLKRLRQGGIEASGVAVQAEWWMVWGLTSGGLGDVQEALSALEKSAVLHEELGRLALAGQALFNAGVIAEHYGEREAAADLLARARIYALKVHDNASVLEIDEKLTGLGE